VPFIELTALTETKAIRNRKKRTHSLTTMPKDYILFPETSHSIWQARLIRLGEKKNALDKSLKTIKKR